ncbi:MAG: CinA family nicotinamide mononucleotide deamidase-related protein [Pseudomonadota bacterium]
MRTAAILAQGEEILAGTTQDTNSSWLARELRARGVAPVRLAAAGDDAQSLAESLRWIARDVDLVVCSGGLGPTDDDCTAEAVAQAFARPLSLDATALDQIQDRFASFHRPMPPSNRKQALLPQGARLLENLGGTAPGFALELGSTRLFFFPGVPRELRAMAQQHLFSWLEATGARPLLRHRMHVCGVGESALQDRLAHLRLPPGVLLGYRAWIPYNSILLYAGPDAADALARARSQVLEVLGEDCLGEEEETLSSATGARLQARGWHLAVAESCTAGGLGALVTEAAGSSAWFAGGIIAYDNRIKRQLLQVDARLLEVQGAVSEACALGMAEGVRTALGVEVGLSITGVAGPGGGTADKPVGTVCLGLTTPEGHSARTLQLGNRGRDLVRTFSAATALEWLRRRLA